MVIAHFSTYTYVEPFLEQVTRVDTGLISTFLLVYGVAGLVGNFVAGSMITRGLRGTWTACAALIATATLLPPVVVAVLTAVTLLGATRRGRPA